jgi:hypothetical protein
MPNYTYNVVYVPGTGRGVEEHMEPEAFPGSAEEFAKAKLLAWVDRDPRRADMFVVVNVWYADRQGVGVPGNIAAQVSVHDLDEGPFDEHQIHTGYGCYHILSPDYLLTDDPVLGEDGLDITHGTPYGLVAPGKGPALKIRAGQEARWITLNVAVLDAEPALDLDQWEAVEQATIRPMGEVRVADDAGWPISNYPDLTDGRPDFLAVRVSARGRDRRAYSGAVHPRRRVVEEHLIEAWPVVLPQPRAVLKRDTMTRNWERSSG